MPSQPESRLVNQIKSVLREKHGCFTVKIHGGPYQQAGIPDLLACYKGMFLALEVKMPGKERELTKLQEHTIREIREAGGYAAMVTSVEEAEEAIHVLDLLPLKKDRCPVCDRPFKDYGSVLRNPEEEDSFRLCIPCHNASSPPEARIEE